LEYSATIVLIQNKVALVEGLRGGGTGIGTLHDDVGISFFLSRL